MRSYSVSNIILSVGALCVVAFSLFTGGCTEVDDRLGANLVPANQKMEIEVTSPEGGVKTYLYRERKTIASRTGRAYLGRMRDREGVFGAQRSAMLLQFVPSSRPYSDVEGYGLDPIIDSMRILFTVDEVRGDSTQVQKFDVWRVNDPGKHIVRDSTYYLDFDAESYRGEKLFEFSHTGHRNVAARLFPTAAGREFLEGLVRMPWDDYWTDTLFLEHHRGLYITPAEGSPAEAAVYGASLATSGLELYVRNHDSLDVAAIFDTLVTGFSFRDRDGTDSSTGALVPWNNVSINLTSHDYTGSVLGDLETATNGFRDTLLTDPDQPLLFVQGIGGVSPYLRFTDEFVETVRNLKFRTDADGRTVGKDIAINQAMMRVWIDDPSTERFDSSLARLGSYLNYSTLLPIADYQYSTENLRNRQLVSDGQAPTYVLPYNGYLNRSNAYYEFDITAYIQRMARIKDGDPEFQYVPPAIFLGPPHESVMGLGNTVLKGSASDRPITVRITYTIIEG